jgi:hypothetical protein
MSEWKACGLAICAAEEGHAGTCDDASGWNEPHLPHGVQLSRKKGWRKPENTIVVARPSRWGNPFMVAEWGLERSLALFANTARGIWSPDPLAGEPDGAFVTAYAQHTAWTKRIGGHPIEMARAELKGNNLACWCAINKPCHRNVLLAIANGWPTPVQQVRDHEGGK